MLALSDLVTHSLVCKSELALALLGLRSEHRLSQAACSNVLAHIHAMITVLSHVSNYKWLRVIDLSSLLLHQDCIQFSVCSCQAF